MHLLSEDWRLLEFPLRFLIAPTSVAVRGSLLWLAELSLILIPGVSLGVTVGVLVPRVSLGVTVGVLVPGVSLGVTVVGTGGCSSDVSVISCKLIIKVDGELFESVDITDEGDVKCKNAGTL